MLGAVIIVVVVVIVLPVGMLMSGGVAAGIIGHFLKEEGEASHPGSELIDLTGNFASLQLGAATGRKAVDSADHRLGEFLQPQHQVQHAL